MAKRTMPVKEEAVKKEPSVKSKEPLKFQVANCETLNVREGPNKESKILFKIPVGTTFFVEGLIDDWFYIRLTSDEKKEGYLLAEYTSEV